MYKSLDAVYGIVSIPWLVVRAQFHLELVRGQLVPDEIPLILRHSVPDQFPRRLGLLEPGQSRAESATRVHYPHLVFVPAADASLSIEVRLNGIVQHFIVKNGAVLGPQPPVNRERLDVLRIALPLLVAVELVVVLVEVAVEEFPPGPLSLLDHVRIAFGSLVRVGGHEGGRGALSLALLRVRIVGGNRYRGQRQRRRRRRRRIAQVAILRPFAGGGRPRSLRRPAADPQEHVRQSPSLRPYRRHRARHTECGGGGADEAPATEASLGGAGFAEGAQRFPGG
mmetsp:Transcript_7792/g.22923  ORF Transcript_7792/g.22923 Transcript_7792/m.22923 type:complete len:282 (-) Transcript_7792:27-872(-)